MLVFEILGRPPEHIAEALKALITRMGSEQGAKVIKADYHDPISVPEAKDLYSAFAEVETEFDSLNHLLMLLFAYMPAHVDVIKPEKITFTNIDTNAIANRLMQRLHDYDAIVKKTLNDRDNILRKLYEVAPHLFAKPASEQESASKSSEKNSKKPKSQKPKQKKK